MHTNNTYMTAHTPAIFTESGMWSAAQLGIVTYHFGSMLVGWSPIHVLTRLMIA